jgi:hypothetical protein
MGVGIDHKGENIFRTYMQIPESDSDRRILSLNGLMPGFAPETSRVLQKTEGSSA